jgi:hypothetical protein
MKTNIKAGGVSPNHNETIVRDVLKPAIGWLHAAQITVSGKSARDEIRELKGVGSMRMKRC